MGDRIVGTAWRIRHTYGRRPLSTFAVTIAAVIALRLSLLAARRAGGTCPSSPGLARVGPVGSAQHSDLVTLAVADEPPPRRRRLTMLVLLCAGVAAAWLLRTRIRERRGLDDQWRNILAAPRPVPTATPASAAGDHRGVILGSAEPGHDRAREPDRWAGDRPGHSDAAASGAERHPCTASRTTEPEPEPEPRRHRTTPSPPRPPRSRRPIPMLRNPRRSRRPQHSPHRQSPLRTSPLTRHSGPASAVPAASAQASVTPPARADAPFGPGSVRARSDGSSPDPAYVVKAKTATKAFYTPAAAYYTRTRADVWFRTADDARAAGFTERAPRRHR